MIKVNRNNLFIFKKTTIASAYNLFIKSRVSACAKATIDIYNFQRKQIVNVLEKEAKYMEDEKCTRGYPAESKARHRRG